MCFLDKENNNYAIIIKLKHSTISKFIIPEGLITEALKAL